MSLPALRTEVGVPSAMTEKTMDVKMGVSSVVFGVFSLVEVINGQEQCNGELWCEQGHCCGSDDTHCCTYYYELWWFWMIWGLIIMLSCCCLYQQHRLKRRQRRALRALQTGVQGRSLPGQPSLSTNGIITGSSSGPYTGSEFRLPTYDEVQDLPKDPPAYEMLFEAERTDQEMSSPCVTAPETQVPLLPTGATHSSTQGTDDSDDIGLLDNETLPAEDPPPAYTCSTSPPPTSPASPVTQQH